MSQMQCKVYTRPLCNVHSGQVIPVLRRSETFLVNDIFSKAVAVQNQFNLLVDGGLVQLSVDAVENAFDLLRLFVSIFVIIWMR